MPPKKTGTATAPKKAAAAAPAHPTYQEMISDAIRNLKDRTGSSRQAIKKYVQNNNNLGNTTDAAFNVHVNRALTKGEKDGVFSRPKGPSGPVKLAKREAKPAAAKPAAPAATSTKKAAPKKASTTTKKAAAPKKTAAATKKTAPKKAAATEPKANTKAKKTAPAAPAVGDDKPAVVLGKTKSGRVTKTKAAGGEKAKKAAPKKAAAKKAAPKKTATPKKADA